MRLSLSLDCLIHAVLQHVAADDYLDVLRGSHLFNAAGVCVPGQSAVLEHCDAFRVFAARHVVYGAVVNWHVLWFGPAES